MNQNVLTYQNVQYIVQNTNDVVSAVFYCKVSTSIECACFAKQQEEHLSKIPKNIQVEIKDKEFLDEGFTIEDIVKSKKILQTSNLIKIQDQCLYSYK